jgi:hypothetical protein
MILRLQLKFASSFDIQDRPSTMKLHSAFAAAPPANGGEYLFVQLPKPILRPIEIISVDLPDPRGEPPIIYRPHLVQTYVHVSIGKMNLHIPGSGVRL